MRTLALSLALLLLAGCATAQPQLAPEWRLVDGAWVGGPANTLQGGKTPPRVCADYEAWYVRALCATGEAYNTMEPALRAFPPRLR